MRKPRQSKFVAYKGRDGKWRWRLVGKNGRKIASSGESFASKRNALRAAYGVCIAAETAEVDV